MTELVKNVTGPVFTVRCQLEDLGGRPKLAYLEGEQMAIQLKKHNTTWR
jgi:hypothetical protein